jgi:polyhydroxyalkanoate synthesis regulator protein
MQALLPSYLEFSIDRFNGEKQAMREAANRIFGADAFSGGSFAALQELTQKNWKAFNQALGIFSPFAAAANEAESQERGVKTAEDIKELRSQLMDMQKRLDSLANKS